MKQFEYKVEENRNESELNKLGSEGWELVAILHKNFIYFYFKREIEITKQILNPA